MTKSDETLETKTDETYYCVLRVGHEHEHMFIKDRAVGCGWPEPEPSTGSPLRESDITRS